MIAFGHSSVGTLVGIGTYYWLPDAWPLIPRLLIAFILGIISHYAADAVPHGHYNFDPKHLTRQAVSVFIIDFFGAIMILSLLALLKFGISDGFWFVLAGIAGAQAPDIAEGFVDLGYIKSSNVVIKHRRFHFEKTHRKTPEHVALPSGARMWTWTDIWQVLVFAIAVVTLAQS